jgi:Flp pilus assembly protein TadG
MTLGIPGRLLRQRGAALVEAIVVSPLMLLLIVGTAEVTNAFVEHNTLTKTTRNAARYLSARAVLGTTGVVQLSADTVAQTQRLAVYGNLAGSGSPVLPGLSVTNVQILDVGNNNIQVSISYPYTGLLGGSLPGFGLGTDTDLNVNLRATVTMRAL